MLPRATIIFLASGGDEMAEGGQTRRNRHQRRAYGKLSQPHQHSHGEPCPGCNSRTVLMHIVGQRDDLKNAVGEPVFYPIAEGETAPAIADFGILAVGLDPSSKAITVTAYGREVFRCCPRASSTTSPAPGAIHWRRLPPISMLNSGPHESFDAAQMSAADHAALRARLLALFPVPGTLLHGYANPLKRRDISESVNRDCREIGGAGPRGYFPAR
jgi:hypothetical protein